MCDSTVLQQGLGLWMLEVSRTGVSRLSEGNRTRVSALQWCWDVIFWWTPTLRRRALCSYFTLCLVLFSALAFAAIVLTSMFLAVLNAQPRARAISVYV